MNIELTDKEFRRLLDLVYIGNWILNSTREKDRFEDYDILQEKLFAQCAKNGMNARSFPAGRGTFSLARLRKRRHSPRPSPTMRTPCFSTFWPRSWRGATWAVSTASPPTILELNARMDEYMDEFEKSGVENLVLET
ncbi:MAG: hypothetical protein ACLSHG_10190 [Oscillospiraceae bacterium]